MRGRWVEMKDIQMKMDKVKTYHEYEDLSVKLINHVTKMFIFVLQI